MASKSLKKSKYFLLFLFDTNTDKNQIKYSLIHCSQVHAHAIVEVIHNLLINQYIKIPSSAKSLIRSHRKLLERFVATRKKKLIFQHIFLNKHFRLIYQILNRVKQLIIQALDR